MHSLDNNQNQTTNMNNSTKVGIIITGPQGCGKTTFINNLLKGNNVAYPSSEETLENLYDLDALVFQGCSKQQLKMLAKLPFFAEVRTPYSTQTRLLQRPLILVETNAPVKESNLWDVIQFKYISETHPLGAGSRQEATDLIFPIHSF